MILRNMLITDIEKRGDLDAVVTSIGECADSV
jgi:hypothetical protein